MESFAIDLDKVLDDFEESEDGSSIAKKLPQNESNEKKVALGIDQSLDINASAVYGHESHFIDLSEANFGPSLAETGNPNFTEPFVKNINVAKNDIKDEGYFVPEELKIQNFQDIPTSQQNHTENITSLYHFKSDDVCNESSKEIEGQEQPEILQAASALQAHLGDTEDRPSFMSSSPPGGSFNHSCETSNNVATDKETTNDAIQNIYHDGDSLQNRNIEVKTQYVNSASEIRPMVTHHEQRNEPLSYQTVSSSEESSSSSGVLYIDQQYSLISSVPDIAQYESEQIDSSNNSKEILDDHQHYQPQTGAVSEQQKETSTSNHGFQSSELTESENATETSISSQPAITKISEPYCDQEHVKNNGLQNSEQAKQCYQNDAYVYSITQEAKPVSFMSTKLEKHNVDDSLTTIESNEEAASDLKHSNKLETTCKNVAIANQQNDSTETCSNVKSDVLKDNSEDTVVDVNRYVEGENQEIKHENTVEKIVDEAGLSDSTIVNNKPIITEIAGDDEIVISHIKENSPVKESVSEPSVNDKVDKQEINANVIPAGSNRAVESIIENNLDINAISNEVESELKEIEEEIKNETVQSQILESVKSNSTGANETSSDAKRRDSSESVERFLALSVMSPGIATPMEDAGFTKIPGFTPELKSMVEDSKIEENKMEEKEMDNERNSQSNASIVSSTEGEATDAVVGESLSTTSNGARPNDISVPSQQTGEKSNKRNRPNSLFGLSTPDLPEVKVLDNQALCPSSVVSESAVSPVNASIENFTNSIPNNEFDGKGHASNLNRPGSLGIIPGMIENVPAGENSGTLQNTTHPQSQAQQFPPQHQQMMLPEQYAPVANVMKTPETPPPAYSVQAPYPFQQPSGQPPQTFIPPNQGDVPEREAEAVENRPLCITMSLHENRPTSLLEAPPGLTLSPGHTPAQLMPPPSSSNPALIITDLGKVPPMWLPDSEAPTCMQCEARFTFTKRRHHCRACGKVYCSTCCNLKSKLQYLENKEARVCSKCYQDLIRAQVFERMGSTSTQPHLINRTLSNNNPLETDNAQLQPQQQQAQDVLQQNAPNPNNPSTNRSSKQVIFSDGVRPGGDLAADLDQNNPSSSSQRYQKAKKNKTVAKQGVQKVTSGVTEIAQYIPQSGLPPIFICFSESGEIIKEDNPSVENTIKQLSGDESSNPVPFIVNNNLVILVKMINLDCCLNKKCICFTSKGLRTVGQHEIIIILECLPNEQSIPLDIFRHYQYIYEQAARGNTVSHMDYSLVAQPKLDSNSTNNVDENRANATSSGHSEFLSSNEYGGFLYFIPTFQCLVKLVLPEEPYLVGVLLQKWEMPWAKVFPLRLLLRLGAEFRYYPCPLVSMRHRKPVYGEIGHTIMNLLVDFRNYQYTIPQVRGFAVHMKDRKTYLNFPRNRYQDVLKALNTGNEHVFAVGATFSQEADSYLVCIQNDEGNYQTQAINIQNKPRKVTGATFVVFNGALKASHNGVTGKSSIVEDGLMIQVLPEIMFTIRDSLKDMKDFTIKCGSASLNLTNSQDGSSTSKISGDKQGTSQINGNLTSGGSKQEEEVLIRWVDDDKKFNVGMKSCIDSFPLDGVECVHVHNTGDYYGPGNRAIRWVEVFFLQSNEESSHLEPVDLSRLAETLSAATCTALAPCLDKLSEAELLNIGLRVTIDHETVGYQVGAKGEKLPDLYMNSLDNELIPVIHNAATQNRGSSVTLELVFYVINT